MLPVRHPRLPRRGLHGVLARGRVVLAFSALARSSSAAAERAAVKKTRRRCLPSLSVNAFSQTPRAPLHRSLAVAVVLLHTVGIDRGARLEAHHAPTTAPGIASRSAAGQKRTFAYRVIDALLAVETKIVASGDAQQSTSQQALEPTANAVEESQCRPAGRGVRRSCGPTPGSGWKHPGLSGVGRAQGGRQTE